MVRHRWRRRDGARAGELAAFGGDARATSGALRARRFTRYAAFGRLLSLRAARRRPQAAGLKSKWQRAAQEWREGCTMHMHTLCRGDMRAEQRRAAQRSAQQSRADGAQHRRPAHAVEEQRHGCSTRSTIAVARTPRSIGAGERRRLSRRW